MSWRVISALTLTAWGALSFGAVYPWAFVPLFAGCAVVGVVASLQRTGVGRVEPALAVSLALLVGAIGLQLMPLSVRSIRAISPESDAFLQQFVVGYPTLLPKHALSIQPRATAVALTAAVALAVCLLGLARSLTRRDTVQFVRGLSVLGVVLVLVGAAQKAMWNGKIYGFWSPMETGDSFGPFVNRNHFAGWMLMALPLSAGYFCGRVVRGMQHVKPGLRNRVLWFSSPDASETILVGFAVLLMALSLTLTLSRSGFLGLLAALLILAWVIASWRQGAGSRRTIVVGYLIFILSVAVGWRGFDSLAARFAHGDAVGVSGRLGIWTDARRLAGRFPITGTGLNTFGTATIFHQTVNLRVHFAEAHNDYLQLLAEGGLLVCVPAGVAIVALAWTARRRFRDISADITDYWVRVGAVTGLVAIAVQETVDFSLQMPGNAVLFVVLASIAIRHPRDLRRPSTSPRARSRP